MQEKKKIRSYYMASAYVNLRAKRKDKRNDYLLLHRTYDELEHDQDHRVAAHDARPPDKEKK